MSKLKIIAFLYLVTFLVSCKKVDNPSENDENYYPVYIGKSNTYRVDSINFDGFRKVSDTIHYFVKETIEELFVDSPQQIWLVNRYNSIDNQQSWQLNAQFLLEKSSNYVKRKEYNVDLMKLIFPIVERKTFNINAFNNLESKSARLLSVDNSKTINGKEFPNCTMVFIQNDSNFFEQKKHIEYYARTVGLIYKEYIDITIQNNEPRGVKYAYTLITHE